MTSERLLSDDGDGVSLGSSEVLEDVVVDTRLVLVVGLGRGSWKEKKAKRERSAKVSTRRRRNEKRS